MKQHRLLTLRCSADPSPIVDGLLRELGFSVEARYDHHWTPFGLSAIRAGRHFRIILHTWPEHGLFTVDLFAPEGRGDRLAGRLEEAFSASCDTSRRARTAPCGGG